MEYKASAVEDTPPRNLPPHLAKEKAADAGEKGRQLRITKKGDGRLGVELRP